MEDSIDNYIHIDEYKNGKVEPAMNKTLRKQRNIYKKLASLNISYRKRNQFIQRIEKERDLILTKSEVVDIFLNYLRTLDLSKYKGKITKDKICKFIIEKNIIRENDLMKEYMPM